MWARFITVAACAIALAAPPARAEGWAAQLGQFGDKMRRALDSDRPLKQREADSALRETLRLSIDAAVREMGQDGAFAKSEARRITLPETLAAFQDDWNAAGRSGGLERLEDSMNQAAEGVAAMAGAPMRDAAGEIDFYDAVAIVRSGDDAASQFYALRAREKLETRLKPLAETRLTQNGAYAALDEAAAAAGARDRAAGFRDAIRNRTLDATIDALLDVMMTEERAIRADPSAYGSPLLSDVFAANSGG